MVAIKDFWFKDGGSTMVAMDVAEKCGVKPEHLNSDFHNINDMMEYMKQGGIVIDKDTYHREYNIKVYRYYRIVPEDSKSELRGKLVCSTNNMTYYEWNCCGICIGNKKKYKEEK